MTEEAAEVLRLHPRKVPVSGLILGTGPLGCGWSGDVSDQAASETIARALSLGIRYVDTAPWYGAGLSEQRVGKALSEDERAPPRREDSCGQDKRRTLSESDSVLVATKAGRYIVSRTEAEAHGDRVERGYDFNTEKYHDNIPVWDYRRDGILESFRQSQERLRMDYIDCLRIHDAEHEERWQEATAPGGGVEALVALRKDGKIRNVSLGFNSAEYLVRTLRHFPLGTFDNIMVASTWNLLDTSAYDLLLECQKRGVKVHMAAVFCAGLLWGRQTFKYSSEVPGEVAAKAQRWSEFASARGLSLPAVALAFAYLPECVERVAFGASSPTEVSANVDLCEVDVPAEFWRAAQQDGLLPAHLQL